MSGVREFGWTDLQMWEKPSRADKGSCPGDVNTSSTGLCRTQRRDLNIGLTLPNPLDSRTIWASCLPVNNWFKTQLFPVARSSPYRPQKTCLSQWQRRIKPGMHLQTLLTCHVDGFILQEGSVRNVLSHKFGFTFTSVQLCLVLLLLIVKLKLLLDLLSHCIYTEMS